MDDTLKTVIEVAGFVGTIVSAGFVATWRASSTVTKVESRLEKVESAHKQLEDDLEDHIKIDNEHHKEDQEQWRNNNRELGEIQGMLRSAPIGRMKSRP